MIDINVSTVPHRTQRYETVGDWQFTNGGRKLTIRVSNCNSWKYEALLVVHELIEALLCHSRGIPEELVDQWDLDCKSDDPGSEIGAPYFKEHLFASWVEARLAEELGVNWLNYEQALEEVVMAPKIGSKDSKAKAIPGTVTTPKDSCVTEGVKGTSTNAKYSDEAPLPGTVMAGHKKS